MDGYEDLPILLSVIQSNKVNIYCIYIKNYPGIEWRRFAFIGVFPGVTSLQMRACGGKEKVQEHVPNLFKPLHSPLPPPRGVLNPRLCPRPPDLPCLLLPACRVSRADKVPRGRAGGRRGGEGCCQNRGPEPGPLAKGPVEEIWGVIGEGGGTAPLCLLLGYIIF